MKDFNSSEKLARQKRRRPAGTSSSALRKRKGNRPASHSKSPSQNLLHEGINIRFCPSLHQVGNSFLSARFPSSCPTLYCLTLLTSTTTVNLQLARHCIIIHGSNCCSRNNTNDNHRYCQLRCCKCVKGSQDFGHNVPANDRSSRRPYS